MDTPRVLTIFTGGTIAMVRSQQTGTLAPPASPTDLLSALPQLRRLADLDIVVLSNIDSSDLQPELWGEIAKTIHSAQDQYDGFVITHGTDTLAYTAAALSLLLDTAKPIICTGAQRPLVGELVSDAPLNLAHAVEAATLDLGEVCVVFGSQLLRGSRAHKLSEFHFEAFTSFGTPPLGSFGVTCRLGALHKHRSPGPTLLRSTEFDARVAWLPVYPGMHPRQIDVLVDAGARGIYLQGYGAGNIPTLERSLVPAIARATERGVTVLIGTQCSFGGVESIYATGLAALDAGAISAGDMSPEMSIVKLMWALGQTDRQAEIARLLTTSIAQERASTPEVQQPLTIYGPVGAS